MTPSADPALRFVYMTGFAAFGHSHPPRQIAAAIPRSCATVNAGTPAGAMPANVSESERATVTAGLANEVDAVNQ
jgi:hypothetical protein